jgi:hypothetical protein
MPNSNDNPEKSGGIPTARFAEAIQPTLTRATHTGVMTLQGNRFAVNVMQELSGRKGFLLE